MLLRKFCSFLIDRSGNFAATFGLTILPAACVVGLALDYNSISRERSLLQETAESAAIFAVCELGKSGYSEISAGEARNFVAASVEGDLAADVDLDPVGKLLTVSLTKSFEPSFLQLVRPGSFDMNVTAQIRYDGMAGGGVCVG